MSEYTPDAWVIVEVKSKEHGTIKKILAGWYGGSNSWKLSSGNLTEYVDGDYIVFPQESGSVYRCHKDAQRMTGYTAQIYAGFVKTIAESDEETTIAVVNYE